MLYTRHKAHEQVQGKFGDDMRERASQNEKKLKPQNLWLTSWANEYIPIKKKINRVALSLSLATMSVINYHDIVRVTYYHKWLLEKEYYK